MKISAPANGGLRLGDPTYDIKQLKAPVVSGWKLQILSYILTQTRFGPSIRRFLLNDNNMHRLRELSAQIGPNHPPLSFPIRRKNMNLREDIEDNNESLYENFLLSSPTTPDAYKNFPRRTIRYYHEQYLSQKWKPSEVMAKTLKQIDDFERGPLKLNIFTSIIPEEVMKAAEESDRRYAKGTPLSVLDGCPVGIKDMIYIKNHINYNGKSKKSVDSAGWEYPTEDDTIVARLRAAGAIILGGTIMTEGGVTPLGWSAHWQGPYNVYDFGRYSGGSSSGSAVAVAVGLVPVAIGFDGGGSIRIPSSMSGIHGLGATFGRIPFDIGLDTTMIKTGPMAASADDVALVYALISPNKRGHFYNQIYDGDKHGPPKPDLDRFQDVQDLSDVRIGIFREWFNDSDDIVQKACYEALVSLERRGAILVDIVIPHLQVLSLAHASKISTEFAMKFDNVLHSRPDSMEPGTKITIGLGSSMSSLEVISADHLRSWAFDYVNDLMDKENLNCIVNPTIGMLPPVISEEAKAYGESNTPLVVQMLKYIFLGNFLGLPGYSVPIGYAPSGIAEEDGDKIVPIGLHFQGTHWSEATLLRLAHAIDSDHMKGKTKLPPVYYDPFS